MFSADGLSYLSIVCGEDEGPVTTAADGGGQELLLIPHPHTSSLKDRQTVWDTKHSKPIKCSHKKAQALKIRPKKTDISLLLRLVQKLNMYGAGNIMCF